MSERRIDMQLSEPSVELREYKGRICIVAYNQGGYDSTWVDLEEVLRWCERAGLVTVTADITAYLRQRLSEQ